MKKQTKKLKTIFKCTRGVSLIEGIISILVFTVLIAAVTSVIMVSMRISNDASQSSTIMQNAANSVAAETAVSVPNSIIVQFEHNDVDLTPIPPLEGLTLHESDPADYDFTFRAFAP